MREIDKNAFAKAMAPEEAKKQPVVAYATAHSNGTVTIDGHDSATPCSSSVTLHEGDRVRVSIDNHRVMVTENFTVPSANDSQYTYVKQVALAADEILDAMGEAAAEADMTLAEIVSAAASANEMVETIEYIEQEADKTLQEILADAAEAGANASIAKDMAEQAASQANAAQSSAESANANAVNALYSLSTVEDVVGTLTWICEHGAFDATSDTSPQEGKRYFTRSGTSPNYSYAPVSSVPYSYALTSDSALDDSKTYYVLSNGVYTAVAEPDVSDIATYYERSEGNPYALGYYEFTGELDATVQNYISSHLSLTDEGLWVTKDGQGCHLLIANDRLSFVGTDGSEVAYIAVDPVTQESTFYMTRSVVVKDLKFGKWMWFERYNRNMALKWVG